MSGICGIVALDGSEPTDAQIRAMTSLLERRGPDGTHHWRRGHVALGHTLLATTPEALHETLPLTEQRSGCTITADVRLDNRDELFEALGIEAGGRVIGDGELILHAFLNWGEDCPKHLLGDFAFAIWDPRDEKLFCARDPLGVRQFVFAHEAGRFFTFATDVPAVLKVDGVSDETNFERVADYLQIHMRKADHAKTWYEEVVSLCPGHTLSLKAGEIKFDKYWELVPGPELKLESEEAYAEAFLDVFSEAVRCRLRSARPVGAMLSGGLDSGTIAAVASLLLKNDGREPLVTFSAIGPDPENCIETRSILAAVSSLPVDAKFINYAEMSLIAPDLIRMAKQVSDPFDAMPTMLRAIYLCAQCNGTNVVLDGMAGDVAAGPGSRTVSLFRRREFKKAIVSAWQENAYRLGDQPFRRRALKFTRHLLSSAANAYLPYRLLRLKYRLLEWLRLAMPGRGNLAAPRFARRAILANARKNCEERFPDRKLTFAEGRARSNLHTSIVAGRGVYDRIAGELGIETRDPFQDARVVKFCLSLPSEQVMGKGWPKLILRNATASLLPEMTRWKRGARVHLGWPFTKALLEEWREWRTELCTLSPYLKDIIRVGAIKFDGHDEEVDLQIQDKLELLFLANFLARKCRSGADKVTDRMEATDSGTLEAVLTKRYNPPMLTVYGNMASLTTGGSIGQSEPNCNSNSTDKARPTGCP